MGKLPIICALAAATLVFGGCKSEKQKAAEAAAIEAKKASAEKEAKLHAADADYALLMRDFGRAEGSLMKAVALLPDDHTLWIGIGMARRQQQNKDGARAAYQKALEIVQNEYEKDKSDPGALLAQIEALLLLDRVSDARKVQDRMLREHPNHPRVREFTAGKELDTMVASPNLQASKV